MYFCGLDLMGDANAANPTGTLHAISDVSIANGIYDTLYLTKDTAAYGSPADFTWTDDTFILSTFNGQNFIGGNVSEYAKDIGTLRLKRREIGSDHWTGIAEKNVVDSLGRTEFIYVDHFARGRDTEYEYVVVPVSTRGIEMDYIPVKVVNNFDGAVIADQNRSYHILLEPSVESTSKNRQATVVTTLNNKYPYVFFSGAANYFSGSFSGVAIAFDEDKCDFDLDDAVRYRYEFAEWLTNGEPKILKMFDGRAWMIAVNGNVELNCPDHPEKVVVSFDFEEIGDPQDEKDLYVNGLTNYSGVVYGEVPV